MSLLLGKYEKKTGERLLNKDMYISRKVILISSLELKKNSEGTFLWGDLDQDQ